MQDVKARHRAPDLVVNNLLDSTRWARISARDGDVVVVTWAKSGTTWVQQILAQLILPDEMPQALTRLSPWIENRYVPLEKMCATLDAQTHRRFMKTHLPANAIEYKDRTKYIFVGRDGRDVVWSWYNHHRNLNNHFYELIRSTPGCVAPFLMPPGDDVREYFLEWLAKDGYPLWPFWAHVRSWWELRHSPNILLLHYDELKGNFPEAVTRIGRFLDMDVKSSGIERISDRCTFTYMKDHAGALLPEHELVLAGGARTFINRGEGGHWREVLHCEDVAAYESKLLDELGEECALWLTRPYELASR